MEDIREKVFEHESKLAKVETILERVALNQDKLADSMQAISVSLDKLVNFETNAKDSFSRVHKRIDSVEKKTDALKLYALALEYPKVTGIIIVSLYGMTIPEIRKLLLGI